MPRVVKVKAVLLRWANHVIIVIIIIFILTLEWSVFNCFFFLFFFSKKDCLGQKKMHFHAGTITLAIYGQFS